MLKQVWVCCPANTGNVNKYHLSFCLNIRLTIAKWFLRDILHVKLLFLSKEVTNDIFHYLIFPQ